MKGIWHIEVLCFGIFKKRERKKIEAPLSIRKKGIDAKGKERPIILIRKISAPPTFLCIQKAKNRRNKNKAEIQ